MQLCFGFRWSALAYYYFRINFSLSLEGYIHDAMLALGVGNSGILKNTAIGIGMWLRYNYGI